MGVNNKAREVNTRVFLARPVLSCALPACRRLLFPLLHAEKGNKGNRRRLHAGNLAPRYYLHAPATQAILLPSVRQRSHDPCGDEIGILGSNRVNGPSQSLIYMPGTYMLPFMLGTINFLLKLKHNEIILML